jgi:hypothetical protein
MSRTHRLTVDRATPTSLAIGRSAHPCCRSIRARRHSSEFRGPIRTDVRARFGRSAPLPHERRDLDLYEHPRSGFDSRAAHRCWRGDPSALRLPRGWKVLRDAHAPARATGINSH